MAEPESSTTQEENTTSIDPAGPLSPASSIKEKKQEQIDQTTVGGGGVGERRDEADLKQAAGPP